MSISNKISCYNRNRKYKYFLDTFKPQPNDTILDVGFNDSEFSDNDNFLERFYPYQSKITALGIMGNEFFSKKYPEVNVVLYDGKKFPFEDKSFDIGWSNAVIEHVGDHEAQLFFLKELLRTCKKLYFTTPNRFFPIEVHTKIPFLHWLPKPLFDKIILKTPKRWAAGDYMNLLSIRQAKSLLKDANVTNYKIKKNYFGGFVMDFCVIVE